MSSNIDLAWAAEESLLSPATRREPVELERLLSADFHEIGQSGRHWTRDAIIAALTTEEPATAPPYEITERAAQPLSDDLVLLTYRLSHGGRVSRRSSVWQVGDGPRLRFHQGTSASGPVTDGS